MQIISKSYKSMQVYITYTTSLFELSQKRWTTQRGVPILEVRVYRMGWPEIEREKECGTANT